MTCNRPLHCTFMLHIQRHYMHLISTGLSKLGIIATLLNTNVRGETLINAIDVTDTKAVIVGQGKFITEKRTG